MDRDAHTFDFVREIRVEPDPGWLGATLTGAARGTFPVPDHAVDIAPRPAGATAAVVAFTARHVIASDLDPEEVVERLRGRQVQLPTDPRFLAWLSERAGGSSEDTVDVVLARPGIAATSDLGMVIPDGEMLQDPRVAFAASSRTDLRVHRAPTGDGVVILGRGLADRLEVSLELDARERGTGRAAELLEVALSHAGPDDLVYAQISAGNSAALRAALRAGFRPICAEYLIR
jgi:GNAT superfamily N-acetyltransferase